MFQTRWTLSYLRGPLGRDQVKKLMSPRKQAAAQACRSSRSEVTCRALAGAAGAASRRSAVLRAGSRGRRDAPYDRRRRSDPLRDVKRR